ncbi:hypothetical protein LFM09_15865 [Lentzea alba]|uniref:hypothetical protein n=1 Tax=Lentzea alba TaxID=2714351 RepID=UPI0039BFB53D
MSNSRTDMIARSSDLDIAGELCRAGGEFFGVQVARYSPAALIARLNEQDVSLVAAVVDGSTIGFAGYAVNPMNRRQATVSVSARSDMHARLILAAHLDLLSTAARIGSFVSVLRADSSFVDIYRAAGFTEVGRLRARRYCDHLHHDEVVLHHSFGEKSGVRS